MRFDVLTLFPEMFEPMRLSIVGRAIEKDLVNINLINIRDFSEDKHKKVDDYPYGGGAGMVIRPDVVFSAYNCIQGRESSKVIYLSPQGSVLDSKKIQDLSREEHLILLCGHYEGVDQRVIEEIVDEEISIGDYVLTGGEIPAMVLIDGISRYIEGVLAKDATKEESFVNGLLEYPQYTRPEVFLGKKVPEVLISRASRKHPKMERRTIVTKYIQKKTRFIK